MGATQRVFVALWPPAAVRAQLAKVARDLIAHLPGGRLVPDANLHLTLAFIGSLEEERVAELATSIARLRSTAFDWQIDRLGAFDRARVLWAGGAASAPLEHLANTTRQLLDELRISYDHKPFAPHITIIRDARKLPSGLATAIAPMIEWHCDRATLVRSTSSQRGPVYQPLTST